MVAPPGRLPAMSLAVVGARFPNSDGSDRRKEILLCVPGEPVELRPEPHNKADPRAVAVFSCRQVQIGYLTAERCGRISQLMSNAARFKLFSSRHRHPVPGSAPRSTGKFRSCPRSSRPTMDF